MSIRMHVGTACFEKMGAGALHVGSRAAANDHLRGFALLLATVLAINDDSA